MHRLLLLIALLFAGLAVATPNEAAAGPYDELGWWIADDDGDGTPNWRDPEIDGEPNPYRADWAVAFHLFNLILFVGIIVYFARRPVVDGVKNRAVDIRRELTEAARLRDEARQRYEELGARLARFEEEVQALRDEAVVDARQDEANLVARATQEAERIQETAGRNIDEQIQRARTTLRAEAVGLAVHLAERTLREQVQSDDQKRIAREFLDSLSNDQDGVNGHGQS